MKRKDVTMNYIKGWFVLDVLASFPYTWVFSSDDASSDASAAQGGSGSALRAP